MGEVSYIPKGGKLLCGCGRVLIEAKRDIHKGELIKWEHLDTVWELGQLTICPSCGFALNGNDIICINRWTSTRALAGEN